MYVTNVGRFMFRSRHLCACPLSEFHTGKFVYSVIRYPDGGGISAVVHRDKSRLGAQGGQRVFRKLLGERVELGDSVRVHEADPNHMVFVYRDRIWVRIEVGEAVFGNLFAFNVNSRQPVGPEFSNPDVVAAWIRRKSAGTFLIERRSINPGTHFLTDFTIFGSELYIEKGQDYLTDFSFLRVHDS